MKLKALLTALFVAGLVVSVAVAAPADKGHKNGTTAASTTSTTSTTGTTTGEASKGKGKHNAKHADRCKPNRSVVLRGTFVALGTGGFAMDVSGGNKVGKKLAGKQVTVLVGESTKVRKHGKASLEDLEAGDRLNVHGRACKLDSQAMTLVAKRVVAHSPSADDQGDEGTTTSTSTTTSTTPAS